MPSIASCASVTPSPSESAGAAIVTVTVTLAVEKHEVVEFVPVTVYVVVDVGDAVTIVVFVDDKPVDGVQLYELAPEAVKETEDPDVIDGADGDTEMVGKAFTITSIG